MDRGWYFRFTVVIAAVVLGWLALWPSIDTWVPAPDFVKETFTGRISPGLDIRGGLRLMYQVDVQRYLKDQRDRTADDLLRRVGRELDVLSDDADATPTDEDIRRLRERVQVQRVGNRTIRVIFSDAGDSGFLDRDWLQENYPDYRREEGSGADSIDLTMREDRAAAMQDSAVEQATRTIANRIDKLGIAETTVRSHDQDIIVEVPGENEDQFERIKSIISRTAQLEFRIVDDLDRTIAGLGAEDLPEGIERQTEVTSAGTSNPQVQVAYLAARGEGSRARLQAYVDTLTIADNREIALGPLARGDDDNPGAQDEQAWRTYVLHATSNVTGGNVDDAAVTFDTQEGNKPVVSVRFGKNNGAELFRALTAAHVKERMAIVLDDRVESAPVIQTEIGGGRCQITLGAYQDYNTVLQEANDLVVVLKAGALDAPLTAGNEQRIGATLGEDSVKKGAEGALIGIGLVLLFMAFYYQVAGVVADAMVLLNLLLILAVLAAFEATLTLPGIAALALTVGMAVDANVLITERIREELRLGKSPRSAVDQGFGRAFWSVFDSQLTTFIAGVVLFQYGTGPIKGFAVMLMIGIGTSLFTGIFCSKVLLDWVVRGLRVERLRVG